MTVSNEQQVGEEAVVRVLRATRANDAEAAPKRHPRQTDQCPNIARFAAVLRRSPDRGPQGAWTAEEARHVRGCAFCQSLFPLFAAAAAATAEAARAAAALAHEDTVTNLSTSDETQTEVTVPKPGPAPKPSAPRAGE
jgi:hypothetical protein